jgi:hypothetical protein
MVAQLRKLFHDESEESLADTIEGLTELDAAILTVLRAGLEREAMGKALGEMIDGMVARKRRIDDGAKMIRLAALQAMQEAGLPKLAAPDMSVSIGRGKPKVIVTAPEQVPDAYWRISREPNKAEIGKALGVGTDVPGAVLGNPQAFLSIHRS